MTHLNVIDAGSGVSIQDRGRPGYQRYGVTQGGVMDNQALTEVNLLSGNPADTAAIEMIAVGGSFSVAGNAVLIACSGGAMDISIDGVAVPWRSSFWLQPGQVVHCGYAKESLYSYLQVAGGFTIEPVLESCSTHTRSVFGGYKGRNLIAGDELPLLDAVTNHDIAARKLPKPDYLRRNVIRIVWGTQANVFSDDVRANLLAAEFSVSPQRDRMGARLDTDAGSLAAAGGLSGVSDAVLIGDIQVAGDGVATVLLADRQPTGGYPRIATVITADLDAITQMPTGRPFKFKLVSTEEAVLALKQRQQQLLTLPALLQPVTRLPEDVADLLSYNLIDGVVAPG